MLAYGRAYRPQYPGYPRQTYRIGDSIYTTGGSEAQRAPSVTTACKLPHQWQTEHKREVSLSLTGQALGSIDRSSVLKTSAQTAQLAARANALSTQAIGNKVAATNAVKAELAAAAAAVDAEMAELLTCMQTTQAALDSKKAPLDAVAKWAALRATRPATEKLCDPVKHDLEVMHTTLSESVRLLDSALAAQQSEMVRLKTKKDQLDADLADKAGTLAIDSAAQGLVAPSRPSTAPASGMSSSIRMPVGYFGLQSPYDPIAWRASSKAICDDARKVVAVSSRVRATSRQLTSKREYAELQVYTDLLKDEAASQESILKVRGATEGQIAACEAEMASIDAQIAACDGAWKAKLTAIEVAAERLALRATRPMRELVQDPAQRALSTELAELKHAARLIEGGVAKLKQDKLKLEGVVEVLRDTVALKSHFLSIEQAGEQTMGVLADLCKNSAQSLPPTAAFHMRMSNRPITALPAYRVSAARLSATR